MAVRRLHHGRCILLIPYVRRNKYLHSLNKAQRKTVLKSWLWLYAFVLIAFEGGGDGINTVFAGY